jgi:transcriptional regulator with XRE-family HTH domain
LNYNKLKELLTQKRINVPALAKEIGMSKPGLYLAIDKERLTVDTLEKIAIALEVPVTVFFETSLQDKEQFEILKKEIKGYSEQVKEYQNTLKRNTLNEQLVLEMYRYFEESLSDEEKNIISANKKYEKFTMYLVSCFGMNIWDEESNEKMVNANKKLFELASKSDTMNDPEKK